MGQVEITEFLLSKGADVNVGTNDNSTPLHEVSKAGHLKLVELLIAEGSVINTKDNQDQTPLSYAEEKDHKSRMVQILICV
jgi:ankyrin repeat protein